MRRRRSPWFWVILAAVGAAVLIAIIVGATVGTRKSKSSNSSSDSSNGSSKGEQPPQPGSPLVNNLSAPSGYTYAWSISGFRSSWDDDAPYLIRTTLNDTVKVNQGSVTECTKICDGIAQCNAFQLVQFPGSDEGNVVCALYGAPLAKQHATYAQGVTSNTASDDKPPQVVASYTFQRKVLRISNSPPSRANPPSPQGASFVQFAACPAVTNATVPMFVNSLWAGNASSVSAAVTTAVIIQQ